jgi:hypothetical protein
MSAPGVSSGLLGRSLMGPEGGENGGARAPNVRGDIFLDVNSSCVSSTPLKPRFAVTVCVYGGMSE